MKYSLLCLLSLCLPQWAAAQTRTLSVENKTACEVKLLLVTAGSKDCEDRQTSEEIRLKAGGTLKYDLAGNPPPGVQRAMGFVGAILVTGEDSCNKKKHAIGLHCAYKEKSKSYVQYNASCNICWTVFAVWEPVDNKGNGRLIFNP